MSNSINATAQPTQIVNASVNPIITLDYVANDPESQGGDFVEYMAASFDYITPKIANYGCNAVRDTFNKKEGKNFSSWSEIASYLFVQSEAKAEATATILQAQSVTPTNVELKQGDIETDQEKANRTGYEARVAVESEKEAAFTARREVVKGLLSVEKDAELIKALALKHSPKFSAFKNSPANTVQGEASHVYKGLGQMIYELSLLGFSDKQIYSFAIYNKDEKSSLMSINDASRKAGQKLGTIKKGSKAKKVETPIIIETPKTPTHGDICVMMLKKETEIKQNLEDLRILRISFDTLYEIELQGIAKIERENEQKHVEKLRADLRLLPKFAKMTDEQLDTFLF